MPFLINSGKAIKSVIEGAINQTILFENSTALILLFVSTYIHVIANIDTKGIAASSAPAKLLLLAISEIKTIKTVVMISFVIYKVTCSPFILDRFLTMMLNSQSLSLFLHHLHGFPNALLYDLLKLHS